MAACWGLTSGNAGMAAQVQALALALGKTCEMKRVELRPSLAWLPNNVLAKLRPLIIPYFMDKRSDALQAPWPETIISCGRRAAAIAMGLKTIIPAGATRFIHIQDPQTSSEHFDLVIAMEHDKITGANVIKTRYALHAITPEKMQQAANIFAQQFRAYAKPHIAVLLGGSTNKYHFGEAAMGQVVSELSQLLQKTEGSLLITPSRRTGEENIAVLRARFAGNPRVYIYNFISDNPYMGMLALADSIVVSNDSVNMMSEARATGKPVYILPLPGHKNTKPARFADALIADGVARPLSGRLERWHYAVGDEMGALAQDVKARLFT